MVRLELENIFSEIYSFIWQEMKTFKISELHNFNKWSPKILGFP